MSSKRIIDSSNEKKKKHCSLSIAKKVELLKKFDQGTPVRNLCTEYGIGRSTAYDLIKQKKDILSFFSESDSPFEMAKRKTIRGANNPDLDKVMINWFKQRRSENVPLTGPMIMTQAKKYHAELGLTTPCDYTTGWLDKFKKRHGIRQIRICGEKISADHEAADLFVTDLMKIVEQEHLSFDQIYNADETALFWRYVPRKTLAMNEEKNPSGIKNIKQRLTVLACANASGTHKLKLVIIGKSTKPRALAGAKTLPVLYKANKRAWVTQELFTDWYKNHFLPEIRKFRLSANLPADEKVLLIIDRCAAHPASEKLSRANDRVLFLPPNCTSILQPMDMGILHALKCKYKNKFLHRMLDYINDEKSVSEFVKEFNVKDALWLAANAWNDISEDTLKNAWHNILPQTLFIPDNNNDEFGGFKLLEEKKNISNLLTYAKEQNINLEKNDLEDIFHCDDDAPTINQLTDEEILNNVIHSNENCSDTESDEEQPEEKIPTNNLIEMLSTVINGLEQRDFIEEHEIMTVYNIREKLIKNKPKMRQLSLLDIFK